MTLFDPPVPRRLLWPENAAWPRRRARVVMQQFQSAFPDITFDMNIKVELANAQAFFDGRTKFVRLFGGLVRHRHIGTPGIAFALAHETGHHLGGPPFMKHYRWLSTEERATTWALTVGLKEVFGADRHDRIAQRGLAQLRRIGVVE